MTPNEYANEIDRLQRELDSVVANAFPEDAKTRLNLGICLVCYKSLDGEKPQRGCHASCYRKINRDLQAGRYSVGVAISAGILAPEQKSGRKAEASGARAELLKHMKLASEIPSQAQPDDDVQDAAIVDVGKKKTAKAKPLPTAAELRDAAKDTDKGTAKRGRRSG